MKPTSLGSLASLSLLVIAPEITAGEQGTFLGDAPPAPARVSHLPRRAPIQAASGEFVVDTASREAVRSFYNAVYRSSDGVPMDSTADVSTCTPGTSAVEFEQATLRRINWFRALAGLPASISLAGTNNVKNRQAAIMMAANNTLSHYPSNNWSCYTAAGAEAAQNSNLALGSAGPDAITGYMVDHGANNVAVGHRRWLLYPQTRIMGTGDVPNQGGFLAANATWVFDGHYFDPRPDTREPYVAWPPAGYVPAPVVFPRWSFALANADFTNATVTLRSNGVAVSVAKSAVIPNVGENTLVWVPLGLNANSQNTTFPFDGTDTVYSVAISNILGAAQTWHTYTVTVFDPAVPGADYFPPVISGPSQPVVGANTAYTLSAVTNATSYEWRAARRTPFSLTEGAETGLGSFTANTSPDYAVRDTSVKASGSYSFRLAHPYGDPFAPQMLTLTPVFIPLSNGLLSVKSRLGYAGEGETARVQISTNRGAVWQDLHVQSGVGSGTSAPVEGDFVPRSFPLGAFAGRPLQLRFNYTTPAASRTSIRKADSQSAGISMTSF